MQSLQSIQDGLTSLTQPFHLKVDGLHVDVVFSIEKHDQTPELAYQPSLFPVEGKHRQAMSNFMFYLIQCDGLETLGSIKTAVKYACQGCSLFTHDNVINSGNIVLFMFNVNTVTL